MDRPFSRFTASCLTTLERTPFYLLSASSSVQTKHPSSFTSSPAKKSAFNVGSGYNMMASLKYLGGGQVASAGTLGSEKVF